MTGGVRGKASDEKQVMGVRGRQVMGVRGRQVMGVRGRQVGEEEQTTPVHSTAS